MQHTEVSPQASESKLWFIGKQPQVQQEKAWQQYYKPTTHWCGELWEITLAPTFFVHLQYIPVGHGNNSLTRRLWPSFSIFYFLGKRRKEYGGIALLCSVLEALGSWNSSWAALIKALLDGFAEGSRNRRVKGNPTNSKYSKFMSECQRQMQLKEHK